MFCGMSYLVCNARGCTANYFALNEESPMQLRTVVIVLILFINLLFIIIKLHP